MGDDKKGLRVGIDPGGLLHHSCCCHLPAEVAAVEEEMVGGQSQLDSLAALSAQLAPHRHCRALAQQWVIFDASQPWIYGSMVPKWLESWTSHGLSIFRLNGLPF